MQKYLVIALIAVFTLPAQAAKLYKWVDEDGNVSYHQRPPRDAGKYKVEEKEFGQTTESQRKSGSWQSSINKYPITLYMVPRCAMCDLVRQYLKSKKLPYSEINVENNKAAQAELTRVSGKLEVPVVTIGKGLVRGYSLEELNSKLIEAGYIEGEEKIQSSPDNLAPTQ